MRFWKVSEWAICVQPGLVPEGAGGLFSCFTDWKGASRDAGLAFAALGCAPCFQEYLYS